LIAQKGLPLSNLCISAELFNNECCFQQKRNILNNKLTKTETEQNEKFVFFCLTAVIWSDSFVVSHLEGVENRGYVDVPKSGGVAKIINYKQRLSFLFNKKLINLHVNVIVFCSG
jgi:hypothetical protein